jgi:ABC-type polysaccharide/polyol phosphate export permease
MIVPFVALLWVFCSGLGMLLATLNVYFRDVAYLYGLILTAWFYLTPILYTSAILPEEVEVGGVEIPIRAIVNANPMTSFVNAGRDIFYDFRSPSLGLWCVLSGIAGVSLVAGGLAFRRFEAHFAEEL